MPEMQFVVSKSREVVAEGVPVYFDYDSCKIGTKPNDEDKAKMADITFEIREWSENRRRVTSALSQIEVGEE
jgi:hypothetical protein